MGKIFIEESTLTALGDGFRNSRGITGKLTTAQMIELAAEKVAEEMSLKPAEYPDYIRTEVDRVAGEVRKVLTDESFVSICLSDSHYPADTNTKASGLHAMMAIKALTYLLPVDFIAHLGDVGFEGSSQTNTDKLEANLVEMLSYVKESAGDSIPLFVAIGNHDPGDYITTDDDTDMISGEYLYQNFTALSASDDTVFSGEATGGYCYRDFTEKKIRVFLLNSAENIIIGGYDNDSGCSTTQLAWFASKLQELNTKSDAASWGIVVLCHYPADYGAARPLSNVIAAYVNGSSITLNGTAYNFSGANAARFIVQHHGHVHNFLVDKLYTGSTPTQYNAYRVGIPNTQDSRENYYGTFSGIQYSEAESQTKTPGTAQDTSFVVNVIDPAEMKIYSFCYGAGYDREIDYSFNVTYYSVSRDLKNSTISNGALAIAEGEAYTAEITPNAGFIISGITVTMGGTDITASAVSGTTVSIGAVTGDISITVSGYTNQIPLSTATPGGTEIYNGVGYKTGTRVNSSYKEVEATNMCCTGYIPVVKNDVIRIKNVTIAGGSSAYGLLFTDAGNGVYSFSQDSMISATVDGVTTLTVFSTFSGAAFRLSCGVIDSTSIITVNEPIE